MPQLFASDGRAAFRQRVFFMASNEATLLVRLRFVGLWLAPAALATYLFVLVTTALDLAAARLFLFPAWLVYLWLWSPWALKLASKKLWTDCERTCAANACRYCGQTVDRASNPQVCTECGKKEPLIVEA
jgi:hypothetical protein